MKEQSKVIKELIKDLTLSGRDVKYDDEIIYLEGNPFLLLEMGFSTKYYFISESIVDKLSCDTISKYMSIVVVHKSIPDNIRFKEYINLVWD